MAFFKRIFEAVRHHYEKIVLVVVLLGLVGAAIALVIYVPVERQKLEAETTTITKHPHKKLPELDLGLEDTALHRAQSPEILDFTTRHKLLNPVLWQILPLPSGRLQKIESDKEIGPGALHIVAINPLYLRVELGEPEADGYVVHVVDEDARIPSQREKNTIVSTGTPGDLFDHVVISGNPPQVQMEFKTNHEAVTITADKPYTRVDGYTVTLSYPHDPQNLVASDNLRVRDQFTLEGERYIVFAITENSVVVSSRANNKKTPINLISH